MDEVDVSLFFDLSATLVYKLDQSVIAICNSPIVSFLCLSHLANMAKAPDLDLLEQLAALDKLVIWTSPLLNEPYWKKEISLTMLDRLYTTARRFYDVTEELYSPDEKLMGKLLRFVNPSPTDSQKAKLKELSILMKLRYPRILAFVHQEYSDVYIWIKEPGGEERTLRARIS
jgi:hypothetical protein